MIDSNQDEAVKLEACPDCGKTNVHSHPVPMGFKTWDPASRAGPRREIQALRLIAQRAQCAGPEDAEDALTWIYRVASGNSGTLPPANLNAPDKQEALAGEGVEAAVGRLCEYLRLDRSSAVFLQNAARERGCDPAEFGHDRAVEEIDQRLADLEILARTLPSNEALAGDDRNGVEWLIERLREESLQLQQRAWSRMDGGQDCSISASLADEAADILERLSRTPSSPQAVEADVERVARAICVASERHRPMRVRCEDPEDNWRSKIEEARAAIATMTTRPAGVEEGWPVPDPGSPWEREDPSDPFGYLPWPIRTAEDRAKWDACDTWYAARAALAPPPQAQEKGEVGR